MNSHSSVHNFIFNTCPKNATTKPAHLQAIRKLIFMRNYMLTPLQQYSVLPWFSLIYTFFIRRLVRRSILIWMFCTFLAVNAKLACKHYLIIQYVQCAFRIDNQQSYVQESSIVTLIAVFILARSILSDEEMHAHLFENIFLLHQFVMGLFGTVKNDITIFTICSSLRHLYRLFLLPFVFFVILFL